MHFKVLLVGVLSMMASGCRGGGEPRGAVVPAPSAPVAAPQPAPPTSAAAVPGLVGHWTFDETERDRAADSSGQGNHGRCIGGPRWVAGKVGGALEFDGKDDVVEIPSSPSLENLQEGSYTIAAWFKPADTPPGQESDNHAHYGIVNKTGWHLGLRYGNDNKFVFEHWLQGDDPDQPQWAGIGTWDETFDPGKWYHVAAVVDAKEGTATIFVNGEEKGVSEAWDPKAKSREYGQTPWRIGHANPGAKEWAWPAKGTIDDVRLYNRPLKAAEIAELYRAGEKK